MNRTDFKKLPRKELLERLERIDRFITIVTNEVKEHEGVRSGTPEGAYPRGYLKALESVEERLHAQH